MEEHLNPGRLKHERQLVHAHMVDILQTGEKDTRSTIWQGIQSLRGESVHDALGNGESLARDGDKDVEHKISQTHLKRM